MEQAIKISVLIPAYNVEAYVDQCLESVTSQTLREIEIIVVDDGSTDSTLAHIEAAAEKDPRIRILRHSENLGLFQARKDAVLVSRGNYIMFVDADDWLEPNACELVYAQAMESGADIVHYGAVVENCGNLPQSRVDGMQKYLDCYLSATIREPLVTTCYRDEAISITMWQKAVRDETAKRAFERMPDARISAAEDEYISLALLVECATLCRIPERLYHYCFGRGACGVNDVSLENFSYHCGGTTICLELDRYLSELESRPEEYGADRLSAARWAAEIVKERIIQKQTRLLLHSVRHKDQAEAFLMMEKTWKEAGVSNFVGLLGKHAWSKRKQVAEALAGADYLNYDRRPVRTVAFYCVSMCNGGVQRGISVLSRELAALKDAEGKARYKVIVLSDNGPSEADFPVSPSVIREYIPPLKQDTISERAEAWARIVREYAVDAVLYSYCWSPDRLWDLLCVKRTERCPAFVPHLHNWCASVYGTPSMRLEELAQTVRLSDGAVVLSETDRLYWQRMNPNTRNIPNPCFTKASETKRASFGKHVLWLARIDVQKQPLEIPRIMQEVVARDPEIICHVVGDENAALRKMLEERIVAEGLSEHIVMEGFHADVVPFYEHSSLFLMTSRSEGFPMTLYEAASFGLPTVMYELPYLTYRSTMEGWVSVPQFDAAAAAEAIVRVLGDPVEWQQRSDALYQSALAYEKTDVTAYWTALLDDLETGKLPEGATLDDTTRLFLDQISYFHGEAVRGLIGEQAEKQRQIRNLEAELNAVLGSLAFRFGTLVAMPWRIVRGHVKGRLKRRG